MVKHAGHQGISLLFIDELGPICNYMAASLCFKSCEDHSLLKSYNGGLWKTFTGLGPELQCFLKVKEAKLSIDLSGCEK